ncbi:hypothetical protein [Hymenobacter sediminis]|uniref:hypothetical protein n=1 Tax=Hymenobacter sediminis TaxID=2218621 RepID=UPI001EE45EA3|nr:hypothetical protein [Hymenobacter sediminis]
MKLLLPSLFAATLLLSACSKDDDTVPMLTGQYRTESTIKAGTLQMYTSTGLVTNQTTITRFLRRLNGASTAFLRRDSTITGAPLELHFRENNRVTLASVVPAGTDDHMIELEVTTRARKHYLLSDLDSVTSYVASPGYGSNQNPCAAFPQNIQEHQPAKRCFPIAMATSFEQVCRLRPLWVLSFRDGQPVIPLLSWLGKSNRNGRYCWLTNNSWNTVSPNLRKNLSPGDTVVVQANEVTLRKQ